jgi:protocatechuate 3,4-dioxygenase beta subunit
MGEREQGDEQNATMSRRQAVRYLGLVASALPLGALFSCGDTFDEPSDDDGDASSDAGSTSGADAGSSTDAGSSPSDGGSTGSATSWASGGTAAMTALASYPNPFSDEVDTTCTPTCTMTEGPCHDDQAPEREDISEGKGGLPMRFGLRILDDNCEPVSDADVDIWHCDNLGVYSSETADNPSFCTGSNAEALAARFFRGHRKTDTDGVAWFSTCFPGWYASRAIHVHMTIRRPARDGDEYLTTQVAFPTALIAELCGSHPDYAGHGQPDTANTSDTVFPSDTVDEYEVETARMSDGALLAWKTLIIRSSLSASVCAASGSSGGGGTPPTGAPPGMGN